MSRSCDPGSASETPNNNIVVAAAVGALASLAPIALHQLGVIEHLPDPPGRLFDSDRITESATAHPLGIPDALLALGSYGATLGLALASKKCGRAETLLGAKLLLDGGFAAFNVSRQLPKFGKLCSWCMGTAVATAVMVIGGRRTIARAVRTLKRF